VCAHAHQKPGNNEKPVVERENLDDFKMPTKPELFAVKEFAP